VKSLEDIKILVIGDIMLDKYVLGEVERISPEAPVPIVHVHSEYCTLGGCGNVARNIKELGPKVACLSSIANDENGKKVLEKLIELDIAPLLIGDSETTITKERVIASERKIQMIRVDREVVDDVEANDLINAVEVDYDICRDFDIVVVSDYAKGVVTPPLMQYLNDIGCKFIVDPKPKNHYFYGNPYLITPNEKECNEIGGPNSMIIDGAKYVLETKGKRGMTLYDNIENWNIDADEVEVYNVSGAGDTVISVMATCLSMGWNPLDSAYIATRCASYVVTKSDTSVVPKSIFKQILKKYRKGI